jgi:hypothetical protein
MRPTENHDALSNAASECPPYGLRGTEGWLLGDAIIDRTQEIKDMVA